MIHNNKRRFLLVFLIFIISKCMFASETFKDGDFYFHLIDGSYVWLAPNPDIRYSGNLVIPNQAKYNGVEYPVRGISSEAFTDCNDLISVHLPASLTGGINLVFSKPDNLESITVDPANKFFSAKDGLLYDYSGTTLLAFPRGKKGTIAISSDVKSLGEYLFYNRYDIKEIILPDNIENIGGCCFFGCENLASVKLPSNLKEIGVGAFEWCPISEITLPDGLTYLAHAFAGTLIKRIRIPKSLERHIEPTDFESNPFYGMKELEYIEVDDENSYFTAKDNVLFSKDMETLIAYPNCRKGTYTIPQTVKIIAANAFDYSDYLSEIEIPTSVTTMYGGFCGCESLAEIYIPDSVETCKSGFAGCYDLTKVRIPAWKEINPEMFTWCISLQEMAVPEGVETIKHSGFSDCHAMESISLPSTLRTLEGFAFAFCWVLNNISIPEGVRVIPDNTFFAVGTKDIVKVTLPSTTEYIDYGAFWGQFYGFDIYLYAPIPPDCHEDAFQNNPKDITVHVLSESYEAYKASPAWNKFNLIADIESSIESITSKKIYIKAQEGKIIILNAENTTLTVANIAGNILYEGKGTAYTEIPVTTQGVYIITAGNISKKILVR